MTTQQAINEADHRWCSRMDDTRWPVAFTEGGKYYVGFTKTDFLYIYSMSSLSYEDAFLKWDNK